MVVARGLGHGLGLGRWRRHATFIRAASSASSASAASAPDKKERGEAYLRRDSDIPLVKETVGQVLQRTAEKFPERPAVISYYQNKRVTFHELIKKADQLGAGLRALGLARNERVAVWGPNSLEWIIAKMACARAGLILVTLNPAFQTEEVTYCLRKANVRAVICNHTFKTQNYHKLMLAAAPDIATSTPGDIKSDVLPDLKALVVISDDLLQGALRLSEVMYAGTDQGVRELRNQQKEVDPFDVVEIQFTSGTTGAPKAAMLTHYNIVNNARIHNLRRFETGVAKTNHDIVCSLVPFFHVFASVIGILACADSGDTLLIASPHFDVKDAYQAIKTEKATVVFGAPTMFVDLLRELERNGKVGMETVQMMFSGGAIASEQLMTKMQEDLPHVQLRQGYGMTETSPAAFTIPHEVDSPKRVLTYVGELLPHLEAKVIDAQGKTVAFGEPGQLCIRGYSVCKGYWDDQEKTRDLIDAKGWLRTGDLFVLEEIGYGKIVGRIKELIIRGAENIAPREIEEVLAKHPNVLEVAVYGVPDERMGEELAAVIRLRDTSVPFTIDDMKEFLKGKVAYFKIPRYMDVLDDFPKNASGKVQKFKLQDAFVKRLKGTK